jgi:hypothetical protein
MDKMTKHIGRVQSTGQRIILLFKNVPNEDGHCLLVEYDRLPDMYKDNLLTILNKPEGQAVDEFYKILENRTFGDGKPVLQTLHQIGQIRKYPHDAVTLTPNNSTNLKLSDLIAYEASSVPSTVETEVNTAILEQKDDKTLAESLIAQAKEFDHQAEALRERAYVICPELRPQRGRPTLTSDERKKRQRERNRVRREKYHQDKVSAASQEA